MELLENRRSWENQRPPENCQKSGLFWASPFTMHLVCTPLKKDLLGVCRKVPHNTRKSLKIHIFGPFWVFLDFFGFFGDFSAERPFWDFFAISGPERPATPANGGRVATFVVVRVTNFLRAVQNWGFHMFGWENLSSYLYQLEGIFAKMFAPP